MAAEHLDPHELKHREGRHGGRTCSELFHHDDLVANIPRAAVLLGTPDQEQVHPGETFIQVLVETLGFIELANVLGRCLFRDEAAELLDLVGLEGEEHARAGDLAYGKQKQLEFAVSLASDPKLLLLDEPTAGMSASETKATMELIKRITAARGLTVLFTEHDMEFVFGIASQLSVLHHGVVIASGDPESVRSDPEVVRVYLGKSHEAEIWRR